MALTANGVATSLAATLLVVLIVVQAQTAEAITCYQCNSEYDPRCGDPFDPYSIATMDCALRPTENHLQEMGYENATLCRKTVQKVYGKIRIVRECGYIQDKERDDQACVKRSGTHDVFAVYCSCTSKLCNSAPPNAHAPFILLAISAILSIFLAVRARL